MRQGGIMGFSGGPNGPHGIISSPFTVFSVCENILHKVDPFEADFVIPLFREGGWGSQPNPDLPWGRIVEIIRY